MTPLTFAGLTTEKNSGILARNYQKGLGMKWKSLIKLFWLLLCGGGVKATAQVVSGPFLQVTVPSTNAAAYFRLLQNN